ncbi:MAG: MerR family transcriptional regulator [bacterium]
MSVKYLEDVEEETGISERNIKYWSQKYELSVEKDGRRNVYPDRTIVLLRLIELLSDSELFTHNFIRLQVQRAQDSLNKNSDSYRAYQEVLKEGKEILSEINPSLGTRIVPRLTEQKQKSTSTPKKTGAKSANQVVDIEDELL